MPSTVLDRPLRLDRSPAPSAEGESALRPQIGAVLGALLVVNATIGTGIFKSPAKVARLTGSLPAVMAVWVAGGLIALCGALTMAELSSSMPRAGGVYEYLRRAWGERVAFVYGWAKLTLLIPSAVGSMAKLSAESVASLFGWPVDPARDAWVALSLVVVCTGANVIRACSSAVGQGIVTAAKYLGVVLLGALGLFFAGRSVRPGVDAATPALLPGPTWLGCFTALVSVMWAYDGWADLASLSAEVRNPGKTMPRALVAGTLAIVAVYLAANAGYASALGLDGLRGATTGKNMVAARLAVVTLGAAGRSLVSVLIAVSCLGGCMSSLMTGPRVFVPMATDGLFFRWLGGVSPRSGVPVRAVLISAALGAGYVLFRSFEQLTDAFVVGYFPFYILAVAAVYKLRRTEPDLARPFRVPGWPVTPLVFLAGAAALMVGALADLDRTAFFALGILAAGLPVSLLFKSPRRA